MKIVIDGRLYGLENAGLGRYLINLIRELSKIDKENTYTVLLRKKYFDELVLPDKWNKVLVDVAHYSIKEQLTLPRIINSQKPDLVHFPHMNVPRFYKGKFVVTVHDLLMQKHRGASATTLPFYAYFPKLLASKYIFRHAVLNAKKILVPSFAIKSEVEEYFKIKDSKVEVTYEGVSDNFSAPTSSKEVQKKDYFLYVGSAYPHKNLDRAIEAVRQTNTQLIIVSGRNVFTENLKKKIKRLKAESNVKILGYLEDTDLVSLYKNSLGFIYPSISEGFGLPGLEAMAAGTLLLASDIPVFREVYGGVPIYFDPYSSSSIAEAISVAVNIPKSERESKIAQGKKLIKNYSWEDMARKSLRAYKEALNS